ncbi:MAG: 50S ribosomal protein L9, partial [Clostridia bacterium]|nr:50S ribosomal protein L9 [Clostridia bacterium]
YGSITTQDIAKALKEQAGIEIDKRKIVSDGAIKAFGSYSLDVKLYPEITGKINLVVHE